MVSCSSVTRFAEDIWLMAGDRVHMFTIPFATRTVLVRLPGGGLWVHSPVALTPERQAAIEELGRVKYIIAPNRYHWLHVEQWVRAFEKAELWVSPRYTQRHPLAGAYRVLGEDAPPEWRDIFLQTVMQGHKMIDEVAFCHQPSGTLILTDTIQNHETSEDNAFWSLVKKLNNVAAPDGGLPHDLRLTLSDWGAFEAAVRKILGWKFDKIVMAHGRCVEKDGHRFFRAAMSRVLKD